MKQKGFTLIELLVVVAIIGILAAVGVVAYSGYTSGAKKSAAKSNHKTVINYYKTEDMKCTMGETTAMDGHLICASRNANDVSIAVGKALADIKNPYKTSDKAVWGSGNISSDSDVGYVRIGAMNTVTVRVEICFATPCSSKSNQIITDFDILQ